MTNATSTPLSHAAVHAGILRRITEARPADSIAAFGREAGQPDASNLKRALTLLEDQGLITRRNVIEDLALTDLGQRVLQAIDVAEGAAVAGGDPNARPGAKLLRFDQLRRDPDQPRQLPRTELDIETIGASIAGGIREPLLVKPPGPDGVHMITDGEGRYLGVEWRIAQGLWDPETDLLPCDIRDEDEAGALLTALVANGVHAHLDPIDEGRTFNRYCELTGASARQAIRDAGGKHKTIYDKMRVAKLAKPEDIARFRAGEIIWKDLLATVTGPGDKLLLALVELEDAINRFGTDGWVAVDKAAGGALDTLVARGLAELNVSGGDHIIVASLTASGREAISESELDTLGRDECLLQARTAVVGEGAARELALQNRYAAPWLAQHSPKAPAAEPVDWQARRKQETAATIEALQGKPLCALVELADKCARDPKDGRTDQTVIAPGHYPDPMRLSEPLVMKLGGGFGSGGGHPEFAMINEDIIAGLRARDLYTPDYSELERAVILTFVRDQAGQAGWPTPAVYVTPWLNLETSNAQSLTAQAAPFGDGGEAPPADDEDEDDHGAHQAAPRQDPARSAAAAPRSLRALTEAERCALVELAYAIAHAGPGADTYRLPDGRLGVRMGEHWKDAAMIALVQDAQLRIVQHHSVPLGGVYAFLTDAAVAWLEGYGLEGAKPTVKDLIANRYSVLQDLNAAEAIPEGRYLTPSLNPIERPATGPATAPPPVEEAPEGEALAKVRELLATGEMLSRVQVDAMLTMLGVRLPLAPGGDCSPISGEEDIVDADGAPLFVSGTVPDTAAQEDNQRGLALLFCALINRAAGVAERADD